MYMNERFIPTLYYNLIHYHFFQYAFEEVKDKGLSLLNMTLLKKVVEKFSE